MFAPLWMRATPKRSGQPICPASRRSESRWCGLTFCKFGLQSVVFGSIKARQVVSEPFNNSNTPQVSFLHCISKCYLQFNPKYSAYSCTKCAFQPAEYPIPTCVVDNRKGFLNLLVTGSSGVTLFKSKLQVSFTEGGVALLR